MKTRRIAAAVMAAALTFTAMPGNTFLFRQDPMTAIAEDGAYDEITINGMLFRRYEDHAELLDGREAKGEVTIPGSIGSPIPPEGFAYDSLMVRVTKIADNAFGGNQNITKIILEEDNCITTVKDLDITIGAWAFVDCHNLREVVIPENVTEIDEGAFTGCNRIKRIFLPASLESVGANAFTGKLFDSADKDTGARVYYAGTEEQWVTVNVGEGNVMVQHPELVVKNAAYPVPIEINGLTFSEFHNRLKLEKCSDAEGTVAIDYPMSLEEGVIENSVCEIAEGAFDGCGSIKELILPGSVSYIGKDALKDCTSLTDIWYGKPKDWWDGAMRQANYPESVKLHFSDDADEDADCSINVEFKEPDGTPIKGVAASVAQISEPERIIDRWVSEGIEKTIRVPMNSEDSPYVINYTIPDGYAGNTGAKSAIVFSEDNKTYSEGIVLINLSKADEPYLECEKTDLEVGESVLVTVKGEYDSAGGEDNGVITYDLLDGTTESVYRLTAKKPGTYTFFITYKSADGEYLEMKEKTFTVSGEPVEPETQPETQPATEPATEVQPSTEPVTEPTTEEPVSGGFGFVNIINEPKTDLKTGEKTTLVVESDIYHSISKALDNAVTCKLVKEDGNAKTYEITAVKAGKATITVITPTAFGNDPINIEFNVTGDPVELPADPDKPYVKIVNSPKTELETGESVEAEVYGWDYSTLIRSYDGSEWGTVNDSDVITIEKLSEKDNVARYRITAVGEGERQIWFFMPTLSEYSPELTFKVTGKAQVSKKRGDANGDGKINVADSVTVLQYIANKAKYPMNEQQIENADIDGQKGISGGDAIAIQRIDAGLDE